MKKLYKEQKNTIYRIQKETGLCKNALYKYINGISDIRNMRFNTLKKIAEIEEIDPLILLDKIVEYQKSKFSK